VNKLKPWLLETRPQFLILSLVLAFIGTAVAWYDGYKINIWHAALAGLGLLLTHAAVNILNDYFDFRSGIDLVTQRTPFSGGSGVLPAGLLSPRQALWLGVSCLALAVPIGIYFIAIKGWELLPLLLLAAFFIILYSPLILKRPWPEWAAGAGLGALPVLGMFFVQAGAYTFNAVIASIPCAFLVHNLLLLNEFPDVEADKTANRRTMPIVAGTKRAAVFYSGVQLATYVWIFGWVAAGGFHNNTRFPVWTLLGLLTLPLSIRAIRCSFHSDDRARFIPGMAANVMAVLGTQLLMGIGYILARAL
jgi:1,4-dihydroxy-2-naphthoate polyprenyltransferase